MVQRDDATEPWADLAREGEAAGRGERVHRARAASDYGGARGVARTSVFSKKLIPIVRGPSLAEVRVQV